MEKNMEKNIVTDEELQIAFEEYEKNRIEKEIRIENKDFTAFDLLHSIDLKTKYLQLKAQKEKEDK